MSSSNFDFELVGNVAEIIAKKRLKKLSFISILRLLQYNKNRLRTFKELKVDETKSHLDVQLLYSD